LFSISFYEFWTFATVEQVSSLLLKFGHIRENYASRYDLFYVPRQRQMKVARPFPRPGKCEPKMESRSDE
jgi:hypothetical protein